MNGVGPCCVGGSCRLTRIVVRGLCVRVERPTVSRQMHARVLDAEKRASSGATQLSQAFGEQERRMQELKVCVSVCAACDLAWCTSC